jgi:hypothetical protein
MLFFDSLKETWDIYVLFAGNFEGMPSCLPSNFFTLNKIEAEFEGAPSCLPSNFNQTREKEFSRIFSEELFFRDFSYAQREEFLSTIYIGLPQGESASLMRQPQSLIL